ncbi:MAG: tyrosine-type recombinase/integrase [Pyrinomonadaceae bacterium]
MNSQQTTLNFEEDSSVLSPTPELVLTRENQGVDTSTDKWRFKVRSDGGDDLTINWQRLYDIGDINETAVYYAKLFISYRLKIQRGQTVVNDFCAFLRFFDWLKVAGYNLQDFRWKNLDEIKSRKFLDFSVNNSTEKGNDFSRIRNFYGWGISNDYDEFLIETYRILERIKAVGNLKGHNVRFSHITKGPFSEDELLLIMDAIKTGKGTTGMRVLIMLHAELGINPLATSLLKNHHLKRFEAAGKLFYQLDVPRIKKRSSVSEVKRRPISNKLGELIESIKTGDESDPLCFWLSHSYPTHNIYRKMSEFSQKAGIISPRTQEILNITPRRFRTTLASKMAEQGASKEHIAETLDHTDLQNVDVYVQTSSTIIDEVTMAIDKVLEPLVNRFKGIIIDSFDDENAEVFAKNLINGDITHLPNLTLDIGGIGGCGRDIARKGLCDLYPPLTCYLCPSFGALRDAPHEKVKASIESYIRNNQERLDLKTLSQFDDIIQAINNVLSNSTTNLNGGQDHE